MPNVFLLHYYNWLLALVSVSITTYFLSTGMIGLIFVFIERNDLFSYGASFIWCDQNMLLTATTAKIKYWHVYPIHYYHYPMLYHRFLLTYAPYFYPYHSVIYFHAVDLGVYDDFFGHMFV